MKTLGNIIWVIFGGLQIAIEYLIGGLALMITIIGIPFGLQSFKLGILALWPFGSNVREKEQQNGCLNLLMNVIWFFVYHHHRHSLRQDALPSGPSGIVALWKRDCLTD